MKVRLVFCTISVQINVTRPGIFQLAVTDRIRTGSVSNLTYSSELSLVIATVSLEVLLEPLLVKP